MTDAEKLVIERALALANWIPGGPKGWNPLLDELLEAVHDLEEERAE